jgi:histidine triad (HIT) family protein
MLGSKSNSPSLDFLSVGREMEAMTPPSECIFCRISQRQIPAEIVFEDEEALAFRDVNPQAPTHILVIPKRHLPSLSDMEKEDVPTIGHLTWVAREIARRENLIQNGYRIVVNNGANAGQTVFHLHVHLLGGRAFGWPPG